MAQRPERAVPRLPGRDAGDDAEALDRVRDALRGLRFGQVTIIVQDGVIVQVERTDKMRLPVN
jgi:hypothetical protein